ncbi:MAG: putative aromatic ring hydroxylating dioxygenase beta subunit [Marmoricola sp.]|nr:putative aromatic ring hydroxylating dioxygenase beta subunit [Marmoricola sp.]
MSDEDLIRNLVFAYARAYDGRDLDGLLGCFVEDATFAWEIANGQTGGPYEGRDAIVASNKASLDSQNDTRRHVMTNVLIEGSGETRSVSSYMTLFAHQEGQLRPLTTGVYTDTVVRQDGRWQFHSRHLLCDLPF